MFRAESKKRFTRLYGGDNITSIFMNARNDNKCNDNTPHSELFLTEIHHSN